MRKFQLNKWLDFSVTLTNKILTEANLWMALSKFYNSIIIPLMNKGINYTLLIQFKIKTDSNIYRSISYIQRVNFNDFDKLFQIFLEFMNMKIDNYQQLEIKEIIFSYLILEDNKDSKFNEANIIKKDIPFTKITNPLNNIPNNMDYESWGEVKYTSSQNDWYNFKDQLNIILKNKVFKIAKLEDNTVEIGVYTQDNLLYYFIDEKLSINTFKRIIYNPKLDKDGKRRINNILYYKDKQLILMKKPKITKFIEPLKDNKKQKLNRLVNLTLGNNTIKVITIDIETQNINGLLIPIAVCIFDGNKSFKFFINDYNNSDDMLMNAIKAIMIKEYDGYKVYLHNFSKFDGVFLLRLLTNLSDNIDPIIRDGRIIELRFKYLIMNIPMTLYFRDSLLLFNSSLKSLCKSFNTDIKKDIFPLDFINNNNITLNYKGQIPSMKYFKDISQEEYNNYIKRFDNLGWSLKDELLNYCIKDCVSLWQILNKFNEEIQNLFNINIDKYPTTPSLAFGIFRQNFLGDNQIPIIDGNLYNDLVKAYYGGRCDMFVPFNNHDEKVYAYDVNSLYPFAMKEFKMPVGNINYFEGNILEIDKNPFGFFEVDIISPDINIPILPFKSFGKGHFSTIFPTGKWKGWYSSIEIFKAIELGYNINILRGYTFEKEDIFSDYINKLYEIKKNSHKNSPHYTIVKLLMNSLYGRFGMNPNMEQHIIVKENESVKIFENKIIVDRISLNNGKELVSMKNDINNEEEISSNLNISVTISAMITAASRIKMIEYFEYINKNNIKIFYTDTDSLYINKPLDNKFINNELGFMKLEGVYDRGVFLAPKVYGLINDHEEVVKVKGLKKELIQFNKLESLLTKDNKLEIKQDKWYKSISKGSINIKNEIYTLKLTDNKRELIYNDKNKLINTKLIKINTGADINISLLF